MQQAAYNENMVKVQAKLKECVDKQSLKNLEHLSAQLATDAMATEEPDVMEIPVEAGGLVNPMEVKGENKAPVGKKKSKRKHKLKSAEKKESEKMQTSTEKRRPRFFCKF